MPEGLTGFADPNKIRLTQNNIGDIYNDSAAIDALRSTPSLANGLPPLRVFEKEGLVYTLDNRLLHAASQAGVPVRIVPATAAEVARKAMPALPGWVGAARAAEGVAYGPLNAGPLAADVANTFRSGTYTANTLSSDTILYRVTSESGNPLGSYWTSVAPKGPLQSVIDSALDQNWGNTATRVYRANVPAGTTVYEGAAAAQRGLVGGGNQIYIPRVDPSWLIY